MKGYHRLESGPDDDNRKEQCVSKYHGYIVRTASSSSSSSAIFRNLALPCVHCRYDEGELESDER